MTIVAGGSAPGSTSSRSPASWAATRLLPSTAGALSACGALYSDVISELNRSRYAETRATATAANEALAEVDPAADAFLADLADARRGHRKEFIVDARYRAQVWELELPIPPARQRRGRRRLEEAFHATHERVFAVASRASTSSACSGRCARPPTREAEVRSRDLSAEGEAEPVARGRGVLPRDGGSRSVPRYDGATLPPVPGRGAGGHPRADDDRRRLSRLGRDVTPLGNYLLEVGGRPGRRSAA